MYMYLYLYLCLSVAYLNFTAKDTFLVSNCPFRKGNFQSSSVEATSPVSTMHCVNRVEIWNNQYFSEINHLQCLWDDVNAIE